MIRQYLLGRANLLEGTEVSELGHLDLFFETLRVLEIRP